VVVTEPLGAHVVAVGQASALSSHARRHRHHPSGDPEPRPGPGARSPGDGLAGGAQYGGGRNVVVGSKRVAIRR
jgi:hypothetical protein